MSTMASAIKCIGTGLIYRNPKPNLYSVHAFFPSVALMANGELLATIVLGEAIEAPNCRTNLARSTDDGETWHLEGPVYPATPGRLITNHSRLTALPDGEVVMFTARRDRTDDPDQVLNPETMGREPGEYVTIRSQDYGHTWTEPQEVTPPLVGPSFELCCPITPLSDGRWILPTHTWPGWDGERPNGLKMVAFVSHDRAQSWPEYMDVMRDPEQRVYYWESKIVELPDQRLLAVAWAHDAAAVKDYPNQYAISHNGGKTWSPPRSTGLTGQTLTPFILDDGSVLSIYRRMDETGLWANLSHLEGDEWLNDTSVPLWGAQIAGLKGTFETTAQSFSALRFGAPCMLRLDDGTVFVAFWCYEDCVSNIRWFKLQVD